MPRWSFIVRLCVSTMQVISWPLNQWHYSWSVSQHLTSNFQYRWCERPHKYHTRLLLSHINDNSTGYSIACFGFILFKEIWVNVSITEIPWALYTNNWSHCIWHCWTQGKYREKILKDTLQQFCRCTKSLPRITYTVSVRGHLVYTYT